MSVPSMTEERERVRPPTLPLAAVELPVVAGNDAYTRNIHNLLHLSECWNSAGELIQPPSFESVDQTTAIWMENKAHTPKFVEEECLEDSLLAYIWQFEDSHAMFCVRAEVFFYAKLGV